jgi:uncharacterized protein (DUF433 family)
MKHWIVADADAEHLGGSPRVRGTRISVALILESLAAGLSVAEIVDAYPSLTGKSVRGALAELAHQNREMEVVTTTKLERLLDEGLENLEQARKTDMLRQRSCHPAGTTGN